MLEVSIVPGVPAKARRIIGFPALASIDAPY